MHAQASCPLIEVLAWNQPFLLIRFPVASWKKTSPGPQSGNAQNPASAAQRTVHPSESYPSRSPDARRSTLARQISLPP